MLTQVAAGGCRITAQAATMLLFPRVGPHVDESVSRAAERFFTQRTGVRSVGAVDPTMANVLRFIIEAFATLFTGPVDVDFVNECAMTA